MRTYAVEYNVKTRFRAVVRADSSREALNMVMDAHPTVETTELVVRRAVVPGSTVMGVAVEMRRNPDKG